MATVGFFTSLSGTDAKLVLPVALAFFGALVSLLIRYGRTSSGRASSVATRASGEPGEQHDASEKSPRPLTFEDMGEIEPLRDLHWEDEIPERIYKFADKYNLTMGIRKTTINLITRIDQQYAERIAERERIITQYPGALGCRPGAEGMVRELYDYLITHYLPQRYPTVFTLDSDAGVLHNHILHETMPLVSPADITETLRILALVVDEDFLMLLPSPDGDGYSLQAFTWLYPVGFDPVNKMGMKLRALHGPVPSYKQHLEASMDRYFARLTPGRVVYRVNWAVATNSSLCERGEYHLYADDQVSSLTSVNLDDTWVRCELQTLFSLPKSGGRILSVHLYLYPLREIKKVGLADEMIRAIDGYGSGNAPSFARYKRIPVWGEVVKKYLRSDEDLDEAALQARKERSAEEKEAQQDSPSQY